MNFKKNLKIVRAITMCLALGTMGCITRYYIYTDIQWKGVWCVLSDDELVEQILLGNENAAEDFLNAS